MHPPVVKLDFLRVVPSPLHLLLGIANLIIGEIYPSITESSFIDSLTDQVKTKHGRSNGAAQVHQLNGPEILRWIEGNFDQMVLDFAATVPAEAPILSITANGRSTTAARPLLPQFRVARVASWLRSLANFLLPTS
ncbi:MAG: hypothetical protein P4L81_04710 [Candidatus Pacebacteria bacterium]|nr:hypothetical protein [Candidatus Paceibacterota bacterium]